MPSEKSDMATAEITHKERRSGHEHSVVGKGTYFFENIKAFVANL